MDVHESLVIKMKKEKYGKILYGGTPIILSLFFIFYYIENKEINFIIVSSLLVAILLTLAMYFMRYAEKIPLRAKNWYYFYLFLSFIWIYYVLEKSPFGLSVNYLMDTMIGFFILASISGFFFIGLLFLHIVETWNELKGENIWKKWGLM